MFAKTRKKKFSFPAWLPHLFQKIICLNDVMKGKIFYLEKFYQSFPKNKFSDCLIGFKGIFNEFSLPMTLLLFYDVFVLDDKSTAIIYYCSRPWYHDYQLKI